MQPRRTVAVRRGVFPTGQHIVTWRHVGIMCALAAYLAWAANNLWHDWQERPGDVEPVQGVEVLV